MKIRRLVLHNYRRHLDLALELPDGVLAIVGPNGSGKSSLLEAIGFALFGVQATRTPKALLRHADAAPSDEVRVELELELAGQALHVMRAFRGANLTAHASLTVDGRPLVASGANSHSAVTQEIERLLGMDRTAFFTSIVAQQKELAKLADLKAQDRKQMILRLLGIDAVDRAIEEARSNRRQSQQRVDDLSEGRADLPKLKQAHGDAAAHAEACQRACKVSESVWDAAKKTLEQAKASHAEQEAKAASRAQLEQQLQILDKARERHETELTALQVRRAAAAQARDQAAALEPAAKQRPEAARLLAQARKQHHEWQAHQEAAAESNRIDQRLAELTITRPERPPTDEAGKQELHAAMAEHASIEAKCSEAQAHLERLSGADVDAPCPFCDRSLHAALPTLRERLSSDVRQLKTRASELERRVGVAQERVQQAIDAQQRWQIATSTFEAQETERTQLQARRQQRPPPAEPPALAPLEDALRTAETAERAWIRQSALADDLAKIEAAAQESQRELDASVADLGLCEQQLKQLPPADLALTQSKLRDAAQAERNAEGSLRESSHQWELAKQAAIHALELLQSAKDHEDRLVKARDELRLWTALTGGRDRGLLEQFRRHMVGKIRPAINQEASRLLARFTDGRYRELILDEDYGVFIVDEGTPFALARFSGGEADLAHLALRLAIGRLLTQRSGAELRFLALDEVFGSLDRHRRDAVLAALHGLEGMYSQIVLVTHQEDLHEALDAVLTVGGDGNQARVEFHQG